MNAKLSRDEMRHTYISVSLGYIYIYVCILKYRLSSVLSSISPAAKLAQSVEEQSFPINCLRFNVSNLSCRRNARIIVVVFEKKNCFKEIGASCQKILIRTRY